MVEKWPVTIPELTGSLERNAYLYLPESYEYEPDRRYPVLYMFDGHNVFFDSDATYGKCWGMKEYMEETETEMIIAAVECNHSPDYGRLKEYSPFSFRDPEFGMITGRGRLTMEWFVNEFKPYIDSQYRTVPEREATFIAGSSMGGLMSLYALLEYNHVFSRAAALSPSLWVSRSKVESMIRRAEVDPDTVLYMDYGSEEFENHEDMMRQYGKVTALLMSRGVMVDSRIVPGGTHCEASWERQIPFFMNTLLY
ncbi:MAG: alpha/beta hydrolase [Clostridium sp.]|nr:alpha/beta hydrolase [Clostridium sp.]